MWKIFQPLRQDTLTEGIHFMPFYLFILPPPSSFLPLTTPSQESPHRTWASPSSDLLWIPSDETGTAFSAGTDWIQDDIEEEGVCVHTCMSLKDTTGCRGPPALWISLCYTTRSQFQRFKVRRSPQEQNDFCSVGCQCVKGWDNGKSERCRNPDRGYTEM